MKRFLFRKTFAMSVATATALAGCGIQQVNHAQQQTESDTRAQLANAPQSRPVFQIHEGAWLRGEQVSATRPQPQIFDKPVSFRDADTHISTLQDIADWIARTYNQRVVIDPSVSASPGISTASAANSKAPKLPELPAGLATSLTAGTIPAAGPLTPQTPLRFTGKFGDFVNTVDQRFGVYSANRDGALTFFKTETRIYTLPDLTDLSQAMTGQIEADMSNSTSSSGSSSGASGSASSSASGSGGQSTTLTAQADPWKTFQESASAIAGAGANVFTDRNMGILTVTGSPAQCDRVEAFMHKLDGMFGKRVAIEAKIYEVRRNQEDNYGMNLALAYKSANGHTGATFTGAGVPTVTSSATPMTFGATIVGGKLDGTKASLQALSTLGNVTEVVSRAGVTQNGKILSLQSATLQDYVPSIQTTLASNVGSSTAVQTATDISGFTSSFRPRVVDGKIVIAFDMTLSQLDPLQTFSAGSSSSVTNVQLRTKPFARFQQQVWLKPGESLVLTGMQQQTTSTTNNGVGSPYMPLAGGGVDAQKSDTMIAIVITARLL
ncbi:type IVB pilus formation outer membrane protein [Caballeronia calidae]|uniref:Type IVB pilus formation outer membrane protein n=1 Tax=Caballeronia calidae TaxID=1777139 RepID=A0A158EG51_9BURK|nr:pilus assembly protein PilN [Caballeronia calidae]SAL05773.1 type IVB pilus formation outer membrane protein [Caballeronia calidae]